MEDFLLRLWEITVSGKRDKKKSILKSVLGSSIYFLVILLSAYLLVNYVIQRASVIGKSMENTMYDGDQMLIDKASYKFRNVKRFEMIVFPQKGKKHTYLIKRVIGLPGETVRIDEDGIIYINDRVLNESFGKEAIKNPGVAKKDVELGAGEYFVLGDNRNDSVDSRFDEIGLIREEKIVGRVVFRLKPFDRIGVVK